MSQLTIPDLLCPFPSMIHPHISEVEEQAVAQWARKLGMVEGTRDFKRLQGSRFSTLVGRAHPTAKLEKLVPVVDFLFWIFLWDDQFDCRIGGELVHPTALCLQNALATQVLEGTPSNGDGASPLLESLAEMREWLARNMPTSWMKRFLQSFREYFDATLWELELRHQGLTPDLETYIQMRRYTSGGYWVTHLIEVAEDIHLSEKVRSHPVMQDMLTSVANIIGWANDLLSLRSELDDSGHLNLVFSLQKEHELPLQVAVNIAVRMHNAEMLRFLQLRKELPSFGKEDAAVERFVNGLCAWMRANIDWSILTGRYEVAVCAALSEEMDLAREEQALRLVMDLESAG
jgi:5-epi-alpha-selinene synthase